MADSVLTTKEAAARLRVTPVTIHRWLRAGRMRGTWLSDRAGWRIPASEVERVLREGFGGRPVKDA